MPVCGTVKRCGDVLHIKDCESCQLRDACSVNDMLLQTWKDWGMGCASWQPKSVYGDGNCAV